jgi:hypothetical protein
VPTNDGKSRTNHPIEIVNVPFYGDSIEAAHDTRDGSHFVSIRRVCENLNIDFSDQLRKLKDVHWATVVKITTVAQDGKRRELAFLPLSQVPAWLTHISPEKVGNGPDDPMVGKLKRYQLEAVDVLYRHFIKPQPEFPDPIKAMAQSAMERAQAALAMREAQLALEGRVDVIQRQVGNLVELRAAALRVLDDVPRADQERQVARAHRVVPRL